MLQEVYCSQRYCLLFFRVSNRANSPALPGAGMGSAGPAGAAGGGTGLASAAAAAAEHAAKTVKGVDRHAAALYLSMKGLHAVPPLLAFSCLKTLDLSRNTLSECLKHPY